MKSNMLTTQNSCRILRTNPRAPAFQRFFLVPVPGGKAYIPRGWQYIPGISPETINYR